MKKTLMVGILSAAFVSPAVFAQAKNFEGFGIQLSTGYQNNQVKGSDLKVDGVPVSQFGVGVSNSSKGEMPLNIGVGYTFALSEKFTLGALVEYNPLQMNAGNATLTFDGVKSTDPLDTLNTKLKNQVSVSLVPGYSFNDSTMGYVRVGWINATATAKASDGSGFSKNTNGAIFGLGAKHLFTKNVFGYAEATYSTYSGSNSSFTETSGAVISSKLTPSSYSFLIGVGARF